MKLRDEFEIHGVNGGSMSDPRLYDDLVMDHIRNARNYRVLDDASLSTTGSNPLCGDELIVYLRMDGDKLDEVSFQCTCCGISMASASIMTELVRGSTRSQASALLREFVQAIEQRAAPDVAMLTPGLSAILDTVARFPARVRCATLAWTTLGVALEDTRAA